jgi:uncharacterized protein YerC
MPKLSKRYLNENELAGYINNLWSVFTLLSTKDQVKMLFRDLFTHTEYKMLAKRLEIARRLIDGQTYDEIANRIKVTSNTINAISNRLESNGEGFKLASSKLKKLLESSKSTNRKNIFPRYKGAPRISEMVQDGIKAVRTISRKVMKNSSASKKLSVN